MSLATPPPSALAIDAVGSSLVPNPIPTDEIEIDEDLPVTPEPVDDDVCKPVCEPVCDHVCDDPHCDPTLIPHSHLRQPPAASALDTANLPSAASLFILPPPMPRKSKKKSHRPVPPKHVPTNWGDTGAAEPTGGFMPMLQLPSGGANAGGTVGGRTRIREQIREFFRSPVPAFWCGQDDDGWDMDGIMMEYGLRLTVGANVGGPLNEVCGWMDKTTGQCENNSLVRTLEESWEEYMSARVARGKTAVPNNVFVLSDEDDGVESTLDGRRKSIPTLRRLSQKHLIKRPPPSMVVDAPATPPPSSQPEPAQLDQPVREPTPPPPTPPPPEPELPKEPLPGDLAAEMEALWDGSVEMRELYAKKRYLKAGMYSNDFKRGGLVEKVVQEQVEGEVEMKGNEAQETKEKADAVEDKKAEIAEMEEDAILKKKAFKFGMPMFLGKEIIERETNFDLPFDLRLFKTLRTGASYFYGSMPLADVTALADIFVDRKPRKAESAPVCNCAPPDEEDDDEGGCGDNCLNRCMFMECSPDDCPCGDACTNQAFQRSEASRSLEVFWTEGRGYGLRATGKIPGNSLVIEYRGEVISQATCINRMETVYADMKCYYFLNYALGEVIDACKKGTEARFVNHSCQPNCRIEKWSVNGEYAIGLFATADIEGGTELTYDYRFESFGPMQPCLCGAESCRGFIGKNKKVETLKDTKDGANKKPNRKNRARKRRSLDPNDEPPSDGDETDDDDDDFTFIRHGGPVHDRKTADAASHLRGTIVDRLKVRRRKVFLIRNMKVVVEEGGGRNRGGKARRGRRGRIIGIGGVLEMLKQRRKERMLQEEDGLMVVLGQTSDHEGPDDAEAAEDGLKNRLAEMEAAAGVLKDDGNNTQSTHIGLRDGGDDGKPVKMTVPAGEGTGGPTRSLRSHRCIATVVTSDFSSPPAKIFGGNRRSAASAVVEAELPVKRRRLSVAEADDDYAATKGVDAQTKLSGGRERRAVRCALKAVDVADAAAPAAEGVGARAGGRSSKSIDFVNAGDKALAPTVETAGGRKAGRPRRSIGAASFMNPTVVEDKNDDVLAQKRSSKRTSTTKKVIQAETEIDKAADEKDAAVPTRSHKRKSILTEAATAIMAAVLIEKKDAAFSMPKRSHKRISTTTNVAVAIVAAVEEEQVKMVGEKDTAASAPKRSHRRKSTIIKLTEAVVAPHATERVEPAVEKHPGLSPPKRSQKRKSRSMKAADAVEAPSEAKIAKPAGDGNLGHVMGKGSKRKSGAGKVTANPKARESKSGAMEADVAADGIRRSPKRAKVDDAAVGADNLGSSTAMPEVDKAAEPKLPSEAVVLEVPAPRRTSGRIAAAIGAKAGSAVKAGEGAAQARLEDKTEKKRRSGGVLRDRNDDGAAVVENDAAGEGADAIGGLKVKKDSVDVGTGVAT
ncbi:Histone-Lysine N-Methyltransferase ash1l [Irineochytrium annulatum]|nr:Histone-Lysine N-Methyltransferase ash1l [Irineochytrium annulatum]